MADTAQGEPEEIRGVNATQAHALPEMTLPDANTTVSTVTERSATPKVTEGSATSKVTEKDVVPKVTEKDAVPTVTEKDSVPAVTEKDALTKVTEKDALTKVTEGEVAAEVATLAEQVWRIDHLRESIVRWVARIVLPTKGLNPYMTWPRLDGVVNIALLDRDTYRHLRKLASTRTVNIHDIQIPLYTLESIRRLDYSCVWALAVDSLNWLDAPWKRREFNRLRIFDWFPNVAQVSCKKRVMNGFDEVMEFTMLDRSERQTDCKGDGRRHFHAVITKQAMVNGDGNWMEMPLPTLYVDQAPDNVVVTAEYHVVAQLDDYASVQSSLLSTFKAHESWAGLNIRRLELPTERFYSRFDIKGMQSLLEVCYEHKISHVMAPFNGLHTYDRDIHGPLKTESLDILHAYICPGGPNDWDEFDIDSDLTYVPTSTTALFYLLGRPIWAEFPRLKELLIGGICLSDTTAPATAPWPEPPTVVFPELERFTLHVTLDRPQGAAAADDQSLARRLLPEPDALAEAVSHFGPQCEFSCDVAVPDEWSLFVSSKELSEWYSAEVNKALAKVRRRAPPSRPIEAA